MKICPNCLSSFIGLINKGKFWFCRECGYEWYSKNWKPENILNSKPCPVVEESLSQIGEVMLNNELQNLREKINEMDKRITHTQLIINELIKNKKCAYCGKQAIVVNKKKQLYCQECNRIQNCDYDFATSANNPKEETNDK